MRYLRSLAVLAVVIATSFAGPAAASTTGVEPLSAQANCLFVTTGGGHAWVITGNWDGVGGDGVGVVIADGGSYHWLLRNGPNAGQADFDFHFGDTATDIPVVGNWDGVGGDGIGVVRAVNGEWQWYLRNFPSDTTAAPFLYGSSEDTPVTGNWDGIGGDGIGAVSPGGGWHLRNAPNAGTRDYEVAYTPGGSGGGDRVTGNWDGVGGDGIGVVPVVGNTFQWRLHNGATSGGADRTINYGSASGCPVPGNWDGVGGDGIGVVYITSAGRLEWNLRNSVTEGNPDYPRFLFP
jgi:hypothetical protein